VAKAPDAFRTISEVSDLLHTPAHVLRFWESKFAQVKPVKRAGGRRYYRPEDIDLLAGIKLLLHEQGMTIKGAQKLLREKGVKHVAGLAPPMADLVAESTESQDATPRATAVAKDVPVTRAPKEVAAPQETAPKARQPELSLAAVTTTPEGEIKGRFFAAFNAANPTRLRARAAQIAPLVARLEAIRAQMRSA
jgi:DNA-binding transcriptional MerR regulator